MSNLDHVKKPASSVLTLAQISNYSLRDYEAFSARLDARISALHLPANNFLDLTGLSDSESEYDQDPDFQLEDLPPSPPSPSSRQPLDTDSDASSDDDCPLIQSNGFRSFKDKDSDKAISSRVYFFSTYF